MFITWWQVGFFLDGKNTRYTNWSSLWLTRNPSLRSVYHQRWSIILLLIRRVLRRRLYLACNDDAPISPLWRWQPPSQSRRVCQGKRQYWQCNRPIRIRYALWHHITWIPYIACRTNVFVGYFADALGRKAVCMSSHLFLKIQKFELRLLERRKRAYAYYLGDHPMHYNTYWYSEPEFLPHLSRHLSHSPWCRRWWWLPNVSFRHIRPSKSS